VYRDMHTMPKKEKNSVTFRNFHVRDAGHLRAFSYAFLCDLKFMSFFLQEFSKNKILLWRTHSSFIVERANWRLLRKV